MINGDFAYEFKQLKQAVDAQSKLIQSLFALISPKDEMWDDLDMVQNLKVSKRTLAAWRSTGVIGYVQYKNKIWYPREAREAFIKANMVKVQGGEDDGSR